MRHTTYSGMMGTNILGQFETQSRGLSDAFVGGLYSLFEDEGHRLHMNLGLSLPTASVTESVFVLTPANTRPELRLPYAMQLGSGTYDLELGATYNYYSAKLKFDGRLKKVRNIGRLN